MDLVGGTGQAMLVESGTTELLNGVVPPLIVTSVLAEKVTGPEELSISRTESAPGVPENPLFGTKCQS